MDKERTFYRVAVTTWNMRLPDPLEQGYETERDLRAALRDLCERWGGRVGESMDTRHGFHLLRFHDTPGGRPDEAWLPSYMLTPAPMPEMLCRPERDETEEEIDRAFGFD